MTRKILKGLLVAAVLPALSTTAFSLTQPMSRLRTRPSSLGEAFLPRKAWESQSVTLRSANGDSDLGTPTVQSNNVDLDTIARFDALLDDGKLKEAVSLLRQNPILNLTRETWNKIFSAIEERTANAEENTENLRALAEFPLQSAARQEMTDMYQALKERDQLTLFGAVSTEMPLAAGSHEVPPQLLEEILGMPMKALTPQPTNGLLFAGVALALLEGFTSVGTGIPLTLLVLWTLLFVTVDRLFINGAIFESFLKIFSPGVQAKILRHEAGHFLAAYLLGCPVEGIVLSAWAALQDRRFGSRQVSAGTSFFDPELSKQINSSAQVTRSSIDRYSIIVMAGIAAEADFYGRADGGAGDELSLVAFLGQLNGKSRTATTVWNNDSIRNQARWGALQAVLLLREYKPAYDALVDALERGGSLGDCIYAIEKAARDHNLKPLREPLGYISGNRWTKENPIPVVAPTQEQQQQQAREFNEEESLAALREYRAAVEEKLRKVEEQLKSISD